MRNTMKAEVFGISGFQEKSFLSFLAEFEDRQKRWHRNPPAPDCEKSYRSDCTTKEEPLCLLTIKEIRNMLDNLELE